MDPNPFWEQPDIVRDFADRAPDVRLVALLESPAARDIRRALDIGCAGGRNTVLLAQHGIEVHALDAARAMVAETRRRLHATLDEGTAATRVQQRRMDELDCYPDAHFDLVLALGIWHSAGSWAEWQRAVAEAARVLAVRGRLLLSHFTPRTELTGCGVQAVPGEPHTYEGFESGRAVLLERAEIVSELRPIGLEPIRPLEVLTTEKDGGRRVSVTGELVRRER
ncbi:MAG: class I SAM-dependent methyltransferase [Gemmatimonadetes bacterium]|nr:class I SAM-dependent methyltransferase [Gemmatimonadota bacterium]